jgi:ATP synthase protein I
MQEYYQLKQTLLLVTLAMTGIIFLSVWVFYSLSTALNYLLGACTGMVYLRMLAKDVERLGQQKRGPSPARFALFIGLFIVATEWQKLQILPIFLGFLTYKAAIIAYVLQSTLLPTSK